MHGPLAYIHVTAALAALISGLFVIIWRKGKALHRLVGLVYVFTILVTNMSALMIYRITGHFDMFHLFALLSLFTTVIAVAIPILRRGNWLDAHVRWMSWSYLGLLAAALNELLVRLPLHVNTPLRVFTAGAWLAAGVAIAGLALRPRLKRAVLRHQTQR